MRASTPVQRVSFNELVHFHSLHTTEAMARAMLICALVAAAGERRYGVVQECRQHLV
jgi:hypothetical protein